MRHIYILLMNVKVIRIRNNIQFYICLFPIRQLIRYFSVFHIVMTYYVLRIYNIACELENRIAPHRIAKKEKEKKKKTIPWRF